MRLKPLDNITIRSMDDIQQIITEIILTTENFTYEQIKEKINKLLISKGISKQMIDSSKLKNMINSTISLLMQMNYISEDLGIYKYNQINNIQQEIENIILSMDSFTFEELLEKIKEYIKTVTITSDIDYIKISKDILQKLIENNFIDIIDEKYVTKPIESINSSILEYNLS